MIEVKTDVLATREHKDPHSSPYTISQTFDSINPARSPFIILFPSLLTEVRETPSSNQVISCSPV